MYEGYGPGYRATFSALTPPQGRDLPGHRTGLPPRAIYLGAVPIAASLRSAIAAVVPNVRDVAVTEAGAGRTDVVVQIDSPRPGQARRAMFAVFGCSEPGQERDRGRRRHRSMGRHRGRLGPDEPHEADRDLLIIPHAGTDRSEPMESGGLVTKAGYDATAGPATGTRASTGRYRPLH